MAGRKKQSVKAARLYQKTAKIAKNSNKENAAAKNLLFVKTERFYQMIVTAVRNWAMESVAQLAAVQNAEVGKHAE